MTRVLEGNDTGRGDKERVLPSVSTSWGALCGRKPTMPWPASKEAQ